MPGCPRLSGSLYCLSLASPSHSSDPHAPLRSGEGAGGARTLDRLVIGLGLLGCAAIVSGTAVSLWRMYDEAIASAEAHLSDLSLALAEQTLRSVNEVDATLLASVSDVRRIAEGGKLVPRGDLHRQLVSRLDQASLVKSIIVMDALGKVAESTSQFPPPDLNYADRDYFRALAARRRSGLHISRSVVTDQREEWVSPFSRRVDTAKGRFLGVVTGLVDLQQFETLYAALNLGPQGSVRLFNLDGVLLASHSSPSEKPGTSFRESTLVHAGMEKGSHVFRHSGAIDALPRITGVRVVKGLPLAVAVSTAEDYVLRGWRRTAWIFAAMALIGILVVLATAMFIARQMNLDQKLRASLIESRERMRLALESADHGIWDLDLRTGGVYRSSIFHDRFANPQQRMPDDPDLWPEILHPDDRPAIMEKHRACIEGRSPGYTAETRVQGKRGEWRWVLVHGQVLERDEQGHALRIAGAVTDITELKEAQASLHQTHRELRKMSKAAQEALEAERRRIARELHDELGQSLTALKMDLDALRASFPQGSQSLLERAEIMRGLLDRTVAATRRISSDLRPLMLDDLGLAAALDWLVQNFSQRTAISTNLYVDDELAEVREPLASALYRIAQESLNNVARHASATSVDVRLERTGDDARVSISDNGRGITLENQAKSGSFGLLGIRERALLLGGDASISGDPGAGTTIQVRIPLSAADREAAPA